MASPGKYLTWHEFLRRTFGEEIKWRHSAINSGGEVGGMESCGEGESADWLATLGIVVMFTLPPWILEKLRPAEPRGE